MNVGDLVLVGSTVLQVTTKQGSMLKCRPAFDGDASEWDVDQRDAKLVSQAVFQAPVECDGECCMSCECGAAA